MFCSVFLKYDSFNVPDILNIHKIALFQKSFSLWYRFCVHDQRQFSETQPAERTQGKQFRVIVIKYLSHIGDSSPRCQLLLRVIIWTLSIYRMSCCWGFVQKGLRLRQGSWSCRGGVPRSQEEHIRVGRARGDGSSHIRAASTARFHRHVGRATVGRLVRLPKRTRSSGL